MRAVVQITPAAVVVLAVLHFTALAWAAVALGLLLALWYSAAYINQTADRRLVKHGFGPGTLHLALSERARREREDQIVRYIETYRNGEVA